MGRPSLYTPELTDKICARIATGESLVKICRDDGMPDFSVIFDWLKKHTDFANKYARAREIQADYLADEIVDISNNPAERDSEGRRDSAHVQQKRLQIDARKWYASKLAPKKYGDKITNEHTGPDGEGLTIKIIKPA